MLTNTATHQCAPDDPKDTANRGRSITCNSNYNATTVMALKTILFYSVLEFFAKRIKTLSMTRPFRSSSSRTSYVKWIICMIFEWSKAIIVVICLREEELIVYHNTTRIYLIATFIYYSCTERLLVMDFAVILTVVAHQYVLNINDDNDGLEHHYHLVVPFLANTVAVALGTILITLRIIIFLQQLNNVNCWYLVLYSYFTIYMRLVDTYHNQWKMLELEKTIFDNVARTATDHEMNEWNDICAICLNKMNKAKITRCKHLYHSVCLRQWLKQSLYCPLCKCDLIY